MPFTIPTIYALRSVSLKNISQRLIFVKNFYKLRSLILLTTLGYEVKENTYALTNYHHLDILNMITS